MISFTQAEKKETGKLRNNLGSDKRYLYQGI